MEFDISGAKIFARIPTGIPILGDILITETIVVSWIVMLIITGLCIFLTRKRLPTWCGTTREAQSLTA